jgi:hypothetical protein
MIPRIDLEKIVKRKFPVVGSSDGGGSFRQNNELSGSIKDGEFLDLLGNYQFRKKDSTA